MRHWIKRAIAIAAPLLLTGCLWGPGKFNSDLTLRKDGSFVLDYRGELVLQVPEDQSTQPWTNAKAKCMEGAKARPCTASEIADQKAEYEKKLQDSAQMAKMFGLPGLDDASNRVFAAKLMKYAGWRSVTYRGKGVFDVDYHMEGRATQDFLFPALPDNNMLIPFIALRRRADGSVLVTAPAFTGGAGPMSGAAAGAGEMAKGGPVSRAEGRFTVVTDGEILTNNSEDGPAPHALGRQLHWDVDSSSKKIPEALIRL
jgi:hypothetical protein